MKYIKSTFFHLASSLIVLASMGFSSAFAKETVVIGQLNWTASLAIQDVLKQILEKQFDVNVKYMALDPSVLYKAMDEGSVDIHPDLWLPNNQNLYDTYAKRGTIILGKQHYVGKNAFFIPGYIQDKHKIYSVKDLKDKETSRLFDVDGDGKGDYWAGAPGWNITAENQVRWKDYGLSDHYQVVSVSDAAIKGLLKSRYKRKKGIIFYYWSPEWLHAKYDLRQLEEPAYYEGCSQMKDPKKDPNWLKNSSINCAAQDAKVYIAYSSHLQKRLPDVVKFINNVKLKPEMINEWVLKVDFERRSVQSVVEQWIQDNQSTVNQWLEN